MAHQDAVDRAVDRGRVALSSAFSSPASEAKVPEIRLSPVAGFSWKSAPRAKEPGKTPS
jgi:hypothetical protein